MKTNNQLLYSSAPSFGWNMFWPVSEYDEIYHTYSAYYGNSSVQMNKCYIETARRLIDNGYVDFIVPTGTAIINLRHSDLIDPDGMEFTRDGYHLETGAGRYTAACALFQTVIYPSYGISCLNNPYRISTTQYLRIPVDDSNATTLQQIAISACTDMFNITYQQ